MTTIDTPHATPRIVNDSVIAEDPFEGVNPATVIEVSKVERLLLALSLAAVATLTALRLVALAGVAGVVLAVCAAIIFLRSDRLYRRSLMRVYPQYEWAEYSAVRAGRVWGSVAIFFAIFLGAVVLNVLGARLGGAHFILSLLFGCLSLVGVYFLPVFTVPAQGEGAEGSDIERAEGAEDSEYVGSNYADSHYDEHTAYADTERSGAGYGR